MPTITLDEVGLLQADPAEGPATPLPGWHVNATHPVPGWEAWRVLPATPRRVFAGVPTVFYTFASKAEYEAARAGAVLEVPTVEVPRVVSARQAWQALIMAGLIDSVQPAIDAIEDPVHRRLMDAEWKKSQEFHRDRPALIALAAAIGLTGEQLDALFIEAAQL